MRSNGRSVCHDEFVKLELRQAEFTRPQFKCVPQNGIYLTVEHFHEVVDVRPQRHFALVTRSDLNDAPLSHFREEQEGSYFLARHRAVVGNVHDFLGYTAFAGIRVVDVGGMLILASLEFFCHGLQSSHFLFGMCYRVTMTRYLYNRIHNICST